MSAEAKKSPKKWETIFSVGGAAAALGLLLIYLFVTPEQLTGPTFLHILHLLFALLAVVSALGLLWMMARRIGKQKGKAAKNQTGK